MSPVNTAVLTCNVNGAYDRSVATLNDLNRRVEKLDENWPGTQAYVSYYLVRAHARRAAAAGDRKDIDLALGYLVAAVAGGVVEAGKASWDDIHDEAFTQLRGNPGYQELIRGR